MSKDYAALVDPLRRATLETDADTPASLRRSAAERAAGGPAMTEPFDTLAREIGEASARVTDTQIAAVRTALGSERAAFEIVAAATLGAGLKRWRAGMVALQEATRAAS
jgi:hypothetical protein